MGKLRHQVTDVGPPHTSTGVIRRCLLGPCQVNFPLELSPVYLVAPSANHLRGTELVEDDL